MSDTVCPYCRTPIEAEASGESEAMLCEGCGTPHHKDCYAENAGCTVFGCRCAPQDEPKLSITAGDVSAGVHTVAGAVGAPPPPPPPPPPPGGTTAHPAFLDAAYATRAAVRQEPYAVGEKVVIPTGTHLPAHCLKCGQTPIGPWLAKTVSWHATWVYILLISPIIYIIVAAIIRKKVALELPLCDEHIHARKSKIIWGWVLVLAWIPILIVGAIADSDDILGWGSLVGFCLGLIGLIVFTRTSIIQPTRITDQFCEFKGASPEFRSVLAPAPATVTRG